MEIAVITKTAIEWLKNGLYIPFFVLMIGILCFYVIKWLRQDSKEREEMLLKETENSKQILLNIIETNKDEAQERESRLMVHLDKMAESNAKTATTLERLEIRMERIEGNIIGMKGSF
ncbi:hypothetical protein MKX42_12370 [Paenibacillus sp. FSL R7-0204]|uniref:hypothetical protein n=1 Tax=Paenibacillus sp. FSL R7-0204 TaxID=2921675 RepID=UPI0030F7CA7A